MDRLEGSPLSIRILPQEDADRLYNTYPQLSRNYRTSCPSCGKSNGPYMDGIVELDGVKWQCNCKDQVQRQKHYLNSGVGMTYQYLWWDDYFGDPEAADVARAYTEDICSNIEVGHGLYLHSENYGTGKSFLATIIARTAILADYNVFMTTFPDMISSTKAGWKDAEYSKWYRARVDSAQLLILDDVGKELMDTKGHNNDFAKQMLDNIVRTRTQQGRPTIMTSNQSLQDLRTAYGRPLSSLMNETMDFVRVTGDDYRPLKKPSRVGFRRVW